MDDESLAELWGSQPVPPMADEDAVVRSLRSAHRGEDRRMLWLNVQEGVPSLLLFFFFGGAGLSVRSGKWAFLGAAVLCLGVGVFLVVSTLLQRRREARFGDTVRDQLQRSLSQVRHREWLYRNIFVWYLLPAALGWGMVVYVTMFRDGPSVFAVVYVALSLAFFGWVYRLNRRVATSRYTPRRRELEGLLATLDAAPPDGPVR